jgi:recombinational DNA repair protein (RecF pathway)
MAYGSAVLELVDDLVVEGEPDAALFDLMETSLDSMARVPGDEIDWVLWSFELSLARVLGYKPEFGRCVVCGREGEPMSSFSAQLGGAVCDGCLEQRSDADVTRGPAFSVLAELAGGGGSGLEPGAEQIANGGRSGATRKQLSPPVREEIGRTLRAFLAACTGRPVRLKSAEFLRQVRRTELAGRGSGGSDDR